MERRAFGKGMSALSGLIRSGSIVGSLIGIGIGLSTEAWAQAPQESMGSSMLAQGLMLAAFAFIFYFLILRPQSKRAQEHRNLISNLQKGDEVITSGGILGKISKINEDFLVVSIADGTEVNFQKQAIVGVLPKGTLKSL